MDRVAVFRGGRGLHDQRAGEAGGRPLDPHHHHQEAASLSEPFQATQEQYFYFVELNIIMKKQILIRMNISNVAISHLQIINIKSFLCGGSENNSNPDPRF